MTMNVEKLSLAYFDAYLKPRAKESHKGSFGHVLVIGGDYGYSGAVRLAAEAALRVGAGLVSVATRAEHALHLNLTRPEIMCHAIHHVKDLIALLKKATVIVLGPGLGQSSWSKKIFAQVIKSKKPLVVDADGLNLLVKKDLSSAHWILTPHPGEAARLLQRKDAILVEDRLSAVVAIQKKYQGVAVLKGSSTLIATEQGDVSICEAGNPGMASGGMGDVLSGVIGGLLAQGMSLSIAAKLGVLLHAHAGDLAAKQGERGMIASDLFPFLRQLVNP